MKRLFKTTGLLATICCVLLSCSSGEENEKERPGDNGQQGGNNGNTEMPESKVSRISSIEQLNQGTPVINSHIDVVSRSSIKMNFRTYTELGESVLKSAKPNYVRVKRMTNGGYIMFYHNNQIGASCSYATSLDFKTWNYRGKIFTNYSITDSKGNKNERRYSNCDGVVLSNGDILAVASYRANSGYRDLPKDAGLEIRRSKDNGATWSEPIEIYQGVNWEPYLLELPSGEIHCYFTDSSRTGIVSTDTGTAMVISKDGGKTWLPSFGNTPNYVIRMKWEQDGHAYFNHQMPSVIKLAGSNELAAAVETNKEGTYYISLVYSGEDGEWDYLNVDQEGPIDSNNLSFYGCAPYLVQFPSGETVLSYNQSSTYYMKMGDTNARNFGNAYAPFLGKGYWGTLNLVDSHQLIGAMPNTGNGTIMLSQFILNHRINAVRRGVKVDSDNSEWANTDHALFVGDKSQAQATLRCSFDDENVYFLVEVLDYVVAKDDYVTIYVSSSVDDDKLDEAYRIRVSPEGLESSEVYTGTWCNTDLGMSVSTVICDKANTNSSDDYGYIAEISIPRSKLKIESGEILVNFAIFDKQAGEDVLASLTNTAHWIPVAGF